MDKIPTITLQIEGLPEKELLAYQDAVHTLASKGVLGIKDGSAEVFFDDLGKVQQIVFRIKKVKRDTPLVVREIKRGTAIAHFDGEGTMQKVIYETFWRRGKDTQLDNS